MTERVLIFVCGIVVGILVLLFLTEDAGSRNACERVDRRVVVNLDNQKHARILDHVWDSWRKGQPRRLHIARYEADENRADAVRGIPTKPGFDRDEYPPAMSDQGGKGSDVRYVRSSENRSAGAVMGNQLELYCNGQRFRFERRPR